MLKFLIVCPLTFIAGFIDAIAGGGGLVSLPAYLITGLPPVNCLATSKLSSCMGTTVATCKYAKNGYIPWKESIFCIPCALLGSSIGAEIALRIDPTVFKMILLVVLPLTALYVLTRKTIEPKENKLSGKVTVIVCMGISLCVGLYDGFYGPGTGTFLILLLVGIARMKLDEANGLTKVVNLSTNLAALTVYLINGQAVLLLGIVAGIFNIAGNYIGAKRFEKGGSRLVKPVMITVIVIFMIKIIVEDVLKIIF